MKSNKKYNTRVKNSMNLISKKEKMPSIDATWKGKCLDRQVHAALCGKIAQIADLSNEFYKDYLKQDVHSTFYNADDLIEDVLIPVYMLEGQPIQTWRKLDNSKKYLACDIHLYGIDFPLYDPRNDTPPFALHTSNKISFVFICSDDPVLEGRLVEVYRKKPDNDRPSGQPVLISPVLDLRYYLLGWTTHLLGWVKHFYIPDMFYWLGVSLAGYERYSDYDPLDRVTADNLFTALLEEFACEAKDFTEYIKNLHKKRE